MTRCPFCGATVGELARHYGGDGCPSIVAAFGAVTVDGKRRELDTHYRLNEMERAWLEMQEHRGHGPRVLHKISAGGRVTAWVPRARVQGPAGTR